MKRKGRTFAAICDMAVSFDAEQPSAHRVKSTHKERSLLTAVELRATVVQNGAPKGTEETTKGTYGLADQGAWTGGEHQLEEVHLWNQPIDLILPLRRQSNSDHQAQIQCPSAD